jgi:hypothetical protein
MNFCKSRYIEVVLMRSTLDVQVFEMDKCYDDIFRERCHMMDRFGEINRYFNSLCIIHLAVIISTQRYRVRTRRSQARDENFLISLAISKTSQFRIHPTIQLTQP